MLTIKSVTFTLIAFLLALTVQSQIKNQGFEQQQGDTSSLVAFWKVKPVDGYRFELDENVKHSGKFALKLSSKGNSQGTFMSFSQMVPIQAKHLTKIAITAFIKCIDVKDESTLWCQVLDENDNMIGFQNLGEEGVKISGTSEWEKYTMRITINAKAKKLLIGGYLLGSGTAWFDDFEIVEMNQKTAPAAELVTTYVQEFIQIVKQNSVVTTTLNWPLIEKEAIALSAGLNTIGETKFILDNIMQELRVAGDYHSFIQDKVDAERYAEGNSNPAKAEARIMPGDIGYVSVPGFSSTSADVSEQFAKDIQNMIHELDSGNRIVGWIVDLRGNNGGNMYPMVAGLGPLTGEGNLGYFVEMVNGKKNKIPWFYKNGCSGNGSWFSVCIEKPYKLKSKAAKIAVLIGPETGSSGEMTAISFIGKRNAKLFGTPSGGYTTGNAIFELSDGSNLVLASSYTADRNMKRYTEGIHPDVIVSQSNDGTDADVRAAESWLLSEDSFWKSEFKKI